MSLAKRYKIRLSGLIAIVVVLCSVCTVGVSAYEPCQQAVKRIVKKTEWPKYSKATILRWTKWGKSHPNYHPPARKPVVTEAEVVDMVAFACGTPETIASNTNDYMVNEEPYDTLGYSIDSGRPFFTELADASMPVALVNVPVQPAPLNYGMAPEPGSWLMVGTGLLMAAFLVSKSRNTLRA